MGGAVWVTLGTALGGMARYWASGWIARRFGETFPWGTLIVNATGSFLIGLVANLSSADAVNFGGASMRLFLMTGFCGGYTTFSSFSLQTLNLVRDAEWWAAAGNVLSSVALCLAAAYLGLLVGAVVTVG